MWRGLSQGLSRQCPCAREFPLRHAFTASQSATTHRATLTSENAEGGGQSGAAPARRHPHRASVGEAGRSDWNVVARRLRRKMVGDVKQLKRDLEMALDGTAARDFVLYRRSAEERVRLANVMAVVGVLDTQALELHPESLHRVVCDLGLNYTWSAALLFLRKQLQKGTRPRNSSFLTVLRHAHLDGDVALVKDTLEAIREVDDEVLLVMALLEVRSHQMESGYRDCCRYFAALERCGRADALSYDAMVRSCVAVGELDRAQQLLTEKERRLGRDGGDDGPTAADFWAWLTLHERRLAKPKPTPCQAQLEEHELPSARWMALQVWSGNADGAMRTYARLRSSRDVHVHNCALAMFLREGEEALALRLVARMARWGLSNEYTRYLVSRIAERWSPDADATAVDGLATPIDATVPPASRQCLTPLATLSEADLEEVHQLVYTIGEDDDDSPSGGVTHVIVTSPQNMYSGFA